MFQAAKVGVASFAGTADNCECVPRKSIMQEPSAKYLLLDETPYIFLKSAKGDSIFTDKAFVSVQGASAVGTKRLVVRADFHQHRLTNVMFESAGMGVTDQDCELKFSIGGSAVSVDIRKSEMETAVLYYRTLTALSIAQANQAASTAMFKDMSKHITFQFTSSNAATVDESLRTAFSTTLANNEQALQLMAPTSYKHIFEQYLGSSF